MIYLFIECENPFINCAFVQTQNKFKVIKPNKYCVCVLFGICYLANQSNLGPEVKKSSTAFILYCIHYPPQNILVQFDTLYIIPHSPLLSSIHTPHFQ